MKKRLLAILLSVGILGGAFIGCGEKKEQPKEPQKQEQTQQEDKLAEIKLKEPFEVKTENGEYTVTINSIKTTKERNEFEEKQPKQVVIIDYDYNNKSFKPSDGGKLLVDQTAFVVMDGEGNVLRTYPVAMDESPRPIPVGGKLHATIAYRVPTDSKEIKLQYERNSGPIGEMIVDIK
ncbi:MAG: DUF4352 domain-containing protein [Clostridium sp.]|uniref:DUF4352 domain-containing protein n=1 Tax=Clostridium sp. LY3-2 TaxID=2942482 RepID=UPI0021529960|nr:DUF4352 domain-containing protein [Clostridium sp. LY3-2]MCR6515284.1 DUF4352 domain-containing protein [Clostridium sp. LY3-2]